jgi:pyruvate kinase
MNEWQRLDHELEAIEVHIATVENSFAEQIASARPAARSSLRNLVDYLALRQLDLRHLQLALSQLGLSSLGRSEGYVRDNLLAVRCRVKNALGIPTDSPANYGETDALHSFSMAESLLHEHTRAIFGPRPSDRHVYIMVTAPDPGVATDAWFDELLAAGGNSLRINGAHGTLDEWVSLAERARAATKRSGRHLGVFVDLPGPKLRTIVPGEGVRVLKLRPERDAMGHVIAACRVYLVGPHDATGRAPKLGLPAALLGKLAVGDRLEFTDARGRHRVIAITALCEGGAIGKLTRTSYVSDATQMRVVSEDGHDKGSFTCMELPFIPAEVRASVGQTLLMCKDMQGSASSGVPTIGCTLPEVFTDVRAGDRIFFDDGKIQGRAVNVSTGRIEIRIEQARKATFAIRSDMGLNLPDTCINVPALTDRDIEILRFAESHADGVALSFVRSVQDIRDLESRIARPDLGVLLKIETKQGFEALPAILLETLSRRPSAVMIARGDLAVELGFERLAEVQEEILWLSEAAHVPVIWATQVLESLAKSGLPTRAEISDAAMAVQAECVMLNKGPFIAEAVKVLASILQRMEAHQYKKRQLYRPLKVSFMAGLGKMHE